MQTPKSILLQNLRRIAMVMGLAMFVLFAYKASNDVSNANIAAGNQRKKTVVAWSQNGAQLSASQLANEQAVGVAAGLNETTSYKDHHKEGNKPAGFSSNDTRPKASKGPDKVNTQDVKGKGRVAADD